MREEHITVARSARYYLIGEPSAPEVWFVCHGYAQLARYFLRPFATLDDGSRLVVAPEALNRYYFETAPGEHGSDARVAATWMTREDRDREIADYIAYLDALHAHVTGDVTRACVVALGFSQGAATVSRWAALGRSHIHHVVLWGSGLAHELEPRPDLFRGASMTIAVGRDDSHIGRERVEREERRLCDGRIDHALHWYQGGHRIEEHALREIAAMIRAGHGPGNRRAEPV